MFCRCHLASCRSHVCSRLGATDTHWAQTSRSFPPTSSFSLPLYRFFFFSAVLSSHPPRLNLSLRQLRHPSPCCQKQRVTPLPTHAPIHTLFNSLEAGCSFSFSLLVENTGTDVKHHDPFNTVCPSLRHGKKKFRQLRQLAAVLLPIGHSQCGLR